MKVAIIGYGIEGKVSAEYWAAQGDEVTVCDLNPGLQIPDIYLTQLGPGYMMRLEQFDIIVRTAGIHPKLILNANPKHPEIAERITTSINEFIRVCPSRNIIGITGTKGKGTTCTLLAKILEAASIPVHLGGNIGIAALQLLPTVQPDDWVVLELSSFQLIDFNQHIATTACLMIAPEHLNWHVDLTEYYAAKSQLFTHQKPGDTTVYNARSKDSKKIASHSPGKLMSYDVPDTGQELISKQSAYVENDTIYYQNTPIMLTRDTKLLGRHNLENICAAISLAWPIIEGNITAVKQVVTTFSGLEHHTEYVATINDIQYIDDSYSTMPDATVAAIAAFPQPKVLIMGGVDKGIPLGHMIKAVSESNVRHVVLIGSMAKVLQDMLAAVGFGKVSLPSNDMTSIVVDARAHCMAGDVVLLSPGCAAKGDPYFIDNKDRGKQFKQVVASYLV